MLAWSEPDALETHPHEPAFGISEFARDALLGAALLAGLVVGLLQDTKLFALLPLVGVLMLLGAIGRRAAGQPPVRASTLWRYAITLVLVAAILAALYFTTGAGASA